MDQIIMNQVTSIVVKDVCAGRVLEIAFVDGSSTRFRVDSNFKVTSEAEPVVSGGNTFCSGVTSPFSVSFA